MNSVGLSEWNERARGQRSEVGGQRSEVRGRRSGIRGQGAGGMERRAKSIGQTERSRNSGKV